MGCGSSVAASEGTGVTGTVPTKAKTIGIGQEMVNGDVELSKSMLGKHKYIIEPGAVVMEDDGKGNTPHRGGVLLVFAPNEYSGLVFSYFETSTGYVYTREFADVTLAKEKDGSCIVHPWAPFFKSIASDVTKRKAKMTVSSGQHVDTLLTITASTEPRTPQPFVVRMEMLGSVGPPSNRSDLIRYVIEPLTRMQASKRRNTAEREKERRYAKLECDRIIKVADAKSSQSAISRLEPVMDTIREQAAASAKASGDLQATVNQLERRLRRLQRASNKHELDVLYDEGGAQFFHHVVCSRNHYPREIAPDDGITNSLNTIFPLKVNDRLEDIPKLLNQPQYHRLLQSAPKQVAQDVFQALAKIDRWDFNAIEFDHITGGNALFLVPYTLLYKLNLVNQFNIEDKVLRNFLSALQAGYHPNPYHNAMHAADVTQINYYIMTLGGLAEKCKLSQEDILAGVLAGAFHDFDHPGYNNNFHTRTHSYLSTLYNDKSILENHHCASVFQILQKPKYNIFANLSEEQRRSVRDTVVEMILSTDMGNHAKIFGNFQRRLSENPDWSTRREDVRLALSVSIKMADISNCARPNNIYRDWARNIAAEFMLQGDAERKMKLSVSPFMDRLREKQEFPKGQISFMNFIVAPMVERIAEFLPNLDFALKHCRDNKNYWENHPGEAQ